MLPNASVLSLDGLSTAMHPAWTTSKLARIAPPTQITRRFECTCSTCEVCAARLHNMREAGRWKRHDEGALCCAVLDGDSGVFLSGGEVRMTPLFASKVQML